MSDFMFPSTDYTPINSELWTEETCRRMEENMFRWEKNWDKKGEIYKPAIRSLYKYRSFDANYPERTSEIFTEKKLWVSSIQNLNDPLETAFAYESKTADPVVMNAITMLMQSNWNGCVSLCFDPVSPLMWAHYAAAHSGYCIEYDRSNSHLLCSYDCLPVQYAIDVPSVDWLDPLHGDIGKLYEQVFFTKSGAWVHEKEWRIRYPRADGYTYPGLLTPKSVIFGLRTPEKTKEFIRGCAENVRFGHIEHSKNPYTLKIVWEEKSNG